MADKILNQSQAIAVRDAMCALNNVSATIPRIEFPEPRPGRKLLVEERANGRVKVWVVATDACDDAIELYHSQSEFFAAYGIE